MVMVGGSGGREENKCHSYLQEEQEGVFRELQAGVWVGDTNLMKFKEGKWQVLHLVKNIPTH